MKKLTAVILGYGMRGEAYAKYSVDHPEELEIVSVAEPAEDIRKKAQKLHNIPDDMAFTDWKQIAALPKMADFAIISTQDKMHYEPALALIEKGYNLLLEKPMAPTAKECKEITEAAEKKGVKVIVCHVLRFTPIFCAIKDIIDNGEIGEVTSIIHAENVGHMHYSHSYVRGNWRNSEESSPMILAKSCHDTDLLQWLIGKKCTKVQSFGSLRHFKKENKPEGAPDYCSKGCPHADKCFYEPVRFYVDNKENPGRDIVAGKVDAPDDEIREALKEGPYGRCVYECDNNVVDRQVVNMEFEDGCTVSFTMAAMNKVGRFIRIFGTKGELVAYMGRKSVVSVYDFEHKEIKKFEAGKIDQSISSGHGGGDTGIMIDTVKTFRGEEPSKSITDVRTSYINHLIAFAAEESRLNYTVIDLEEFSENL